MVVGVICQFCLLVCKPKIFTLWNFKKMFADCWYFTCLLPSDAVCIF